MIEAEQARLPDLSAITVLLPNLHAAPALARALGQAAGRPTLLLPTLTTLPQLAKQASLVQPSVPDSERQSLLYGALRARKWFRDATLLWPLTGELLKLFDELTLNQIRLPDSHEDFYINWKRPTPPPPAHRCNSKHAWRMSSGTHCATT